MALPKTFGGSGTGDHQNKSSTRKDSSIYGDSPQQSLPSDIGLPEIEEDDPFVSLSTSSPLFYDEDDISGGFDSGDSSTIGRDRRTTASPYDESKKAASYTQHSNEVPVIDKNLEELKELKEKYPATIESVKNLEKTVLSTGLEDEENTNAIKEAMRNIRREDDRETTFIDNEKKLLKPFGVGSSKLSKSEKKAMKDIKVHEFDHRKNLRNRSKITTISFLVVSILLILLAGYKVFLNKDSLTVQEVVNITNNTTGNTGFPMETGQAIAESFIEAYLSTDDPASDAIISMYYGGTNPINRNYYGDNYKQIVTAGPFTFESIPLTSYSAAYTVGAQVTAELPELPEDYDERIDGFIPENSLEWVFFSVNVYLDEESGTFSIPPNSPTLTASPPIDLSENTPNQLSPGTGEKSDELTEVVRPLVISFLEAYSKSSYYDDKWKSLSTYTVDPVPIELKNGFDGKFTFDPDRVEVIAYETEDDPNDPTAILKTTVNVTWMFSSLEYEDGESDNGLEFTSNYVITLEKVAEPNTYKVSKMAPIYYVKADANE